MTVSDLLAASKTLHTRMRYIPGVIAIGPDEDRNPIIWAYVNNEEVAKKFPNSIDGFMVIVETVQKTNFLSTLPKAGDSIGNWVDAGTGAGITGGDSIGNWVDAGTGAGITGAGIDT